ncbi:T-cell-interacting, activating receptor on myeloid cells protein 1-like [Petaurus breviceps papuanus]|uniref:T-cell-interacting, activating receptor on myeloid cells protein 1-like n=1 Tax=Petaurus breviceps papuanus TaxID=3040969 RepID=UPI0036D7DB84
MEDGHLTQQPRDHGSLRESSGSAETRFFSKPSLQVQPGTVVTVGETVTLVCQVLRRSSIRKLTFFLLKAGVPAPLQHQRVEGQRANFTLPSVKAEEAGNYSCVYSEQEGRKRASDPSEVLSLEVTGKKNAHPERNKSGVVLIAGLWKQITPRAMCCASAWQGWCSSSWGSCWQRPVTANMAPEK